MENVEQELAEIKSMMERSTRFLSLSGLSGILAGTYALLAAGLGYYWIYYPNPPFGFRISNINAEDIPIKLVLTALVVLIASVFTAYFLSQKKSIKSTTKLWTPASKRFVQALMLPLVVGGLFCIALLVRGNAITIAPATLIFYGLALIHAAQFTLSEIKYLGYCQLILGVISAFFPGYGLIFWSLGFGVLHVVYGVVMHFKYDR